MILCWPRVCEAGPTLAQQCVYFPCLTILYATGHYYSSTLCQVAYPDVFVYIVIINNEYVTNDN